MYVGMYVSSVKNIVGYGVPVFSSSCYRSMISYAYPLSIFEFRSFSFSGQLPNFNS